MSAVRAVETEMALEAIFFMFAMVILLCSEFRPIPSSKLADFPLAFGLQSENIGEILLVYKQDLKHYFRHMILICHLSFRNKPPKPPVKYL